MIGSFCRLMAAGPNIFEGTSGNTTGYGTAFNPPYEYQSMLIPTSQVKARVSENVLGE